MAIDHNTPTGARSRPTADNTMSYIIGTILVAAIIGMLYYAYGDRLTASSTITSPPATNTQTTSPRTATPPASTTPTTPVPTPSTK